MPGAADEGIDTTPPAAGASRDVRVADVRMADVRMADVRMAECRIADVAIGYPVYCAPGALDLVGAIVAEHAPAHRYAIISDASVAPLYADRVRGLFPDDRATVHTIPSGEHEKTRERWAELTDQLLHVGCGRDSTVIALGGGVIGDLAGFVAATYMRGIPVVQVPTTLLAMVDASVGGKTGVDTPAGKNLVGAFHDACAVVIDPAVLDTLPPEILRSGFAEIVKHGVIASERYFGSIGTAPIDVLIAGSVRIKAATVEADHHEHGVRHTLNFGHTVAHALEAAVGFGMLHGDAVAIGMVAEARMAESMRIAEAGTAEAIAGLLDRLGLPTALPDHVAVDAIIAGTRSDKKAREGHVRYALPERIGRMAPGDGTWALDVPDTVVAEALTRSGR